MSEDVVETLLASLCFYGLGMKPEQLSPADRKRQVSILRTMLKHHEPEELAVAIRYGMPHVWPFNQDDGRPYDAVDLERNLLKARAAARRMLLAGKIPTYIRTK